ncbi:uncharacterized protein BT62DRAFT_584950 [Guyanagaster necrorhizus]|uniref:Uncharacterized protein n=1 Tax=Guyanagaster necrorhizus TaxID=856835 RepID=A0A9P7VGD2_9AGAR|nr:uncharacterized protein BT62DRAFT_584950 [Guyanagaster necrorhizus MCA 3950]KAG7440476.1 hypothetical protein BT62DRAFT_584950 [Guyanagaster necrorhizus MCA 3950]
MILLCLTTQSWCRKGLIDASAPPTAPSLVSSHRCLNFSIGSNAFHSKSTDSMQDVLRRTAETHDEGKLFGQLSCERVLWRTCVNSD